MAIQEAPAIAIVGLACRFPDADDSAGLLDLVTTGRRAFRRIPSCRVDLADYYEADQSSPDTTYSARAALIEGWQFDRSAFGVGDLEYASNDLAVWLALETAARVLAAAGCAGGAGLPRDRAGVFVGNALTGDVSRALALRLRWPYARRVIAEAMSAAGVPGEQAAEVLRVAAGHYLGRLPRVTPQTLAGNQPAAIAATICQRFGFRGAGSTVDAGGASSLSAVASACLALACGELDVAIAGGVEASLDPLDLVGMAKAGLLATGRMRIYDQDPSGFLPGEGCGMVMLMRAADARAAGLPVYAEILGWGAASASRPENSPDLATGTDKGTGISTGADADAANGQLLAMWRAYDKAQVDPADIQLVEGCGSGVAATDEAELAALAQLRAGAPKAAALGSISANIGNTRAAAGVAGLIKAVLAISNGVLPPSTGIRTPHPVLSSGHAALRCLGAPESWPDGPRLAGVSAIGAGEHAVHLVLRKQPEQSMAQPRSAPPPRSGSQARSHPGKAPRGRSHALTRAKATQPTDAVLRLVAARPRGTYSTGPGHPFAFLVGAPDRSAMVEILDRIWTIAPTLSDGQMQDLAVNLARVATCAGQVGAGQVGAGQVRIALVAARQEQLARLASDAKTLLPALTRGSLVVRPGIFAGCSGDGCSGDGCSGDGSGASEPGASEPGASEPGASEPGASEPGASEPGASEPGASEPGASEGAAGPVGDVESVASVALLLAGQPGPAIHPERELDRILAITDWLDKLGVSVGLAATRGIGELAGLAWAGCVSPAAAQELAILRSAALAAPADTASGQLSRAIDGFTAHEFTPPRRRLVSGCTGRQISARDSIAELLSAELFEARLAKSGQRPERSGRELVAAVRVATAGASLILQTSHDRPLNAAVKQGTDVTSVSIVGDPADDRQVARAAAALFAIGALARPESLYADRPSRPIDIWRDQTFITHPCQAALPPVAVAAHTNSSASPDRASQRDERSPASGDPVAGAGAWARCYVEELRPPVHLSAVDLDRPWRVHTGGCDPLRVHVSELFRPDPEADRTLAVLGGLDDAGTREAVLRVAQDAIGTGQLVVISPGPALTGLWASLRAEHPSVGITVVRAPLTQAGIVAAAQVAAVAPGRYRELVIGADGTVSEPVMTPAERLGGADFPLGQGDVVLVSRGSCAAGLALAQVLACSGAAVAIVGRDHPEQDSAVIAGLEQLRGAGARIGYEVVDMTDHGAMVAAVRRVEARFGRVTAISHATGPAPRVAIAELTRTDVHEQLRRQTAPLDQLVAAARAAEKAVRARSGRLRLIATFGSVVSRYGLAQEGLLALATGALADSGERLAAASPGCQALHVDWPTWSGTGLGERADLAEAMERAGFAAILTEEGARILLKLLAADRLPARPAVHGRVGVPAPRPIAICASAGGQVLPGRFVERVLVHYPDVELVAEATLSLRADPYLADYVVDGVAVLPPVMALEAMAQVASMLAGASVRSATGVRMDTPIGLPSGNREPEQAIRICALRDGDLVRVVLRSDVSGFAVDHCRASFRVPRLASAAEHLPSQPELLELPDRAAPSLDASELYGSALFQSGRFRRLATVYLTGSKSAIGLVHGADSQPWFGPVRPADRHSPRHSASTGPDSAGPGLVLGSAGISDAALQLVQACVPHRRLILAGCDAVEFSGLAPGSVVMMRAQRVDRADGGLVPMQRAATAGPGPAAGAVTEPPPSAAAQHDHRTWDVAAVDASGQAIARWQGLRMRDAGPVAARMLSAGIAAKH